MWIGSPLRGTFRLLSFLTLSLVLVPPYYLMVASRINPVVRWGPVVYHRILCVIVATDRVTEKYLRHYLRTDPA